MLGANSRQDLNPISRCLHFSTLSRWQFHFARVSVGVQAEMCFWCSPLFTQRFRVLYPSYTYTHIYIYILYFFCAHSRMSCAPSYLAVCPLAQRVPRVTWLYFGCGSKWTETVVVRHAHFWATSAHNYTIPAKRVDNIFFFLLSPRCFSFSFLSIVGFSCCYAMFSFSTALLLDFLPSSSCCTKLNVSAQPGGTNAKWQQTIWSNKIKRAYEVGGLAAAPGHNIWEIKAKLNCKIFIVMSRSRRIASSSH